MHHKFENSSSLASMHHDKDENVLTITFASGKTYQYSDCTHDEFEALKNAESPGRHFQLNIKNLKDLI